MDDTEKQELHIEKQVVRQTRKTRPGPVHQDVGNTDDMIIQQELQQRKMEEDKLLSDAGIPVEGMGDEEKRQILEALRESLPAPEDPIPSTSTDMFDAAEKLSDETEETMREDPQQTLPDMETNYDDDDDDNPLCDSTTSAATPVSGTRRTSKQSWSKGEDSKTAETGWTRRSCRQRRKARAEESDGDTCSSTSEMSEDGDGMKADLLTCSLKNVTATQNDQMKLSITQKEQGKSRFKTLYNKMSLSLSQQSHCSQSQPSLSPVAEERERREEAVHSSQDLFNEELHGQVKEAPSPHTLPEPIQCHDSTSDLDDGCVSKAAVPDSVSVGTVHKAKNITASSSPSCALSVDSSSSCGDVREVGETGDQGEVIGEDDMETQPPEDFELNSGEEEKELEQTVVEKDKEVEDGQTSPVTLIKVTPSNSPSLPPDGEEVIAEEASPLKSSQAEEETKSPLRHDNWFSWPPVPPVCCLQRSYKVSSRKRKEPPSYSPPFFCPDSEDPGEYSKVIVQMFDAYFLHFTCMQSSLPALLPWGKPVRSGMHHDRSLDWKKRGRPCFNLEWDDEEDFEPAEPPRKKLSSEHEAVKGRGKASPLKLTSAAVNTRIPVVADSAGNLYLGPGEAGDSAAAYDAETQPFDMDDELPDIDLGSTQVNDGRGRENTPTFPSPAPVCGGSQSSNSLLDDNGNLYSTQLPRRKRQAEAQRKGVADGGDRQKRMRRAVQLSDGEDDDGEEPVRDTKLASIRPPSKRKQPSPASLNDHVCILNDDDDDEISFPQKKKIHIRGSERGFVHISSSSRGEGTPQKAAVVRPTPRRASPSKTSSVCQTGEVADEGEAGHHTAEQGGVSSSSDVKGLYADDSDDSVQYVEPASLMPGTKDERTMGSQSGREASTSADGGQEEPEETVPCPLCNRQFPVTVIEQHASDCYGEEEEENTVQGEVAQQLAVKQEKVYPGDQLKRRPLRSVTDRKQEEFVCALCSLNMRGQRALERHFEKCKLTFAQFEAGTNSPETFLTEDGDGHAANLRSAPSRKLAGYKIPRKTDGSNSRVNQAAETTSAEEEEEIHIDSDDSCKDPDYSVTRDDKSQERDDLEEEEEGAVQQKNPAGSTFKPISKLKDSPIDFKNQFCRKQRNRLSKARDKE